MGEGGGGNEWASTFTTVWCECRGREVESDSKECFGRWHKLNEIMGTPPLPCGGDGGGVGRGGRPRESCDGRRGEEIMDGVNKEGWLRGIYILSCAGLYLSLFCLCISQ